MDRVWEEMRVADDVRIRRQFRAYSSGRQEDLQVGDYVFGVVLPLITNSRKLAIKWSGPLIINRFANNTMIETKEICVKKPRVYLAHHTKLWLAKCNGMKDLNPSFFSTVNIVKICRSNGGCIEYSGITRQHFY